MREISFFHLYDQVFYETQRQGEGHHCFFICLTMSFKALRVQVRDMSVFNFLIMCFIKLTTQVSDITVFHLSDNVF